MALFVNCARISFPSRFCRSFGHSCVGPSLTARRLSVPVMATTMKIALCQLKVGKDKIQNINNAREKIKEAANSAGLVMLPEMWNCPYSNDSFPEYCEPIPNPPDVNSDGEKSPCFEMMKSVAKECGIYLVGGSIPESQNQQLFNTACVFGPRGEFLAKHRKVHLFDIDIPGKIRFNESETLTPGSQLTMFETPFGKVGVGICYDIRFPEMAQIYAKSGAKLLLYPGAFNTTTGPAHWEVLQRARAIDNQLYVATCSPSRNEDGYEAWGHSTVSGPFGEVICTCDEKETILYANLNMHQIEQRRSNMPLTQQKRNDLYELIPKS